MSGLIGSRTAAKFAERTGEFRIVGLDVKPPHTAPGMLDFLKTDLTDDGSVKQSLRTVREKYGPNIASIIHLAAYYDFSGEPSPLYRELTVEGTRRLLREIHSHEMLLEQFVFFNRVLSSLISRNSRAEDRLTAPTTA